MKLRRAVIDNFRGVKHVDIDFCGPDGQPRPVTAIFGDNGSGKTTVLQAIALTMSLATEAIRQVTEFRWNGYIAERIMTLGETRVELHVQSCAEEVAMMLDRKTDWRERKGEYSIPDPSTATVTFDGAATSVRSLHPGWPDQVPSRRSPYVSEDDASRLGDIFWFDQFRGLPGAGGPNGGSGDHGDHSAAWSGGVEELRRRLISMWTYHLQPHKESGPDRIPELEASLSRMWPGTTIRGLQPRRSAMDDNLDSYWFMFERNGRVFELSEMSSGEQAVFPLLYRFLRQDINRSIVLIDELELHLHPPEQQALLAALPKLGNDCQFIITSHSQYLEDVIPVEERTRLSEGVEWR